MGLACKTNIAYVHIVMGFQTDRVPYELFLIVTSSYHICKLSLVQEMVTVKAAVAVSLKSCYPRNLMTNKMLRWESHLHYSVHIPL